jgi:hypothetical protein
VAGEFGVGEGGRERVPAGLGQDLFGELGYRLLDGCGVPLPLPRRELSAPALERAHGVPGGTDVGGAQMLGGLLCCGGLLVWWCLVCQFAAATVKKSMSMTMAVVAPSSPRPRAGPLWTRSRAACRRARSWPRTARMWEREARSNDHAASRSSCLVWAAEVLARASRTSPPAAICAAVVPSSPWSMISTVDHAACVAFRRADAHSGADGLALIFVSGGGVLLVGGEAFPDAREGEVGGELGAGVEDGLACLVVVPGHGDGVAEQVTGGGGPSADEETGGGEPVEELRLTRGAGHCTTDPFTQLLARRPLALLALGFVSLGAGGALRGRLVAGVTIVCPGLLGSPLTGTPGERR